MLKPPKSQPDSASDNGSQNIASDKQKINILKKAVLELRDEKLNLQKTIAELTEKNDYLIKEKADIEEKYGTMIHNLQEQIGILNQQISTRNTITPVKSNINPLILDDSGNSQQYLRQIKQLQQELKSISDNHEAQMSILQTGYKELERDIKNKDTLVDKLTKELEEKNQMSNQLKKNIEDIERDLYNKIKDHSSQNMQLQLKLKTLDKEMQQKDEEIRILHKGLDDSRFNVAQLQAELEETRGKFIQYRLTLHNQFLDIECLFILRQNIFNDYIFELETAAQRFVYKASEITDLKAKDEKSFMLSVKSRTRDEIFTIGPNQDLKKICKSIKNFLLKAQQYHAQQALQHHQVQSPASNGLLGGLMSIFGSNNQIKNGSTTSNANSDTKQK